MKISLNWLKEFIELNDSPEKIGEMLTNTGLEVEDIEKIDSIPGGLDGFVIGEVITCEVFEVKEKKLSLTTVDIGQEKLSNIVCGADNVAKGQKVIVATLGTSLYDTNGKVIFKIENKKVYGQPSEGMICAEDEIGIGQSHDGILVLKTDLPNGTPASKYFNIESDYVFEIGLTPNRADAASHLGVARDLMAVTGNKIKMPKTDYFTEVNKDSPIEVIIENPEACPRFCGIYIENVTIAPSPIWLQNRLKAIGLNPINNIVDITNYCNHELGQPMHAYDAEAVLGNKIVVKNLAEGTKFITLDNQERTLKGEDLMICNGIEPMGIGGIFGGTKSGIKSTTKNIYLEVAYFNPVNIRKTAQNHSLKTDASFRFERGTDPNLKIFALKRAASLIVELTGGKIASNVTDIYPKVIPNVEVKAKYSRINSLIGKVLAKSEIKKILNNLDIIVKEIDGDNFVAEVPAFRVDVTREADLVEEVLRIYGFENIELSSNLGTTFISSFPTKDKNKIQNKISQQLVGAGFSEISTNSLTKPAFNQAIKGDFQNADVEILNKLSEDLGVMRQSLLFSGLEVLAYNINRRQKDLKIFDFGKIYSKSETKYIEKNRLSLFVTGNIVEETWQKKSEKVAFHLLSGETTNILNQLKVKNIETKPIEKSAVFAYGVQIIVNKKEIGNIGLVKQNLLKMTDIKVPVFYADLDWDYLFKQYNDKVTYTELSKFPDVKRDLSLIIDKNVTYTQIEKLALLREKELLKSINVFDVFEGENLGKDKKSYSVSFILQDTTQTLNDKVIDKVMEKLIFAFEKELGAVIRK